HRRMGRRRTRARRRRGRGLPTRRRVQGGAPPVLLGGVGIRQLAVTTAGHPLRDPRLSGDLRLSSAVVRPAGAAGGTASVAPAQAGLPPVAQRGRLRVRTGCRAPIATRGGRDTASTEPQLTRESRDRPSTDPLVFRVSSAVFPGRPERSRPPTCRRRTRRCAAVRRAPTPSPTRVPTPPPHRARADREPGSAPRRTPPPSAWPAMRSTTSPARYPATCPVPPAPAATTPPHRAAAPSPYRSGAISPSRPTGASSPPSTAPTDRPA